MPSLDCIHALDVTGAAHSKGLAQSRCFKKPRFITTFECLGNSLEEPPHLFHELEEFTCAIYGKPHVKKIDDLRLQPIKQNCGVDDNWLCLTMLIWPEFLIAKQIFNNTSEGSIIRLHFGRKFTSFSLRCHPMYMAMDGHCIMVKWYEGNFLPQKLIDILDTYESGERMSQIWLKSNVHVPQNVDRKILVLVILFFCCEQCSLIVYSTEKSM